MIELEQQILAFVEQIYTTMGWPGVVLLMAIESVFIPLPSEVVMPLSGWMLIKAKGLDASYTLLAGFYGAVGSVIGSVVIYAIGRWGGRSAIKKYGKYVLISPQDLAAADRWFSRYGNWAVLLSRVVPVVRSLISFPAGVAKMNFGAFLLLTFLGSLPWSWGLAYAGYLAGEHWEEIRSVMRPFDIPVILAIVALLGVYIYRHVKRSRTAVSREATAPKDPR